MSGKRCICGRSAHLPLCDGSHRTEDWSCDSGRRLETAFASVGALENLSRRLAARRGGLVAPGVRCRRLVALTDGTDLVDLRRQVEGVEAEERVLIWVGVGALDVWPGWTHRAVTDGPGLWAELISALDGGPTAAAALPERVFLSHASADEESLEPLAAYLRGLGVEVFLCADSIASGSGWQRQITKALDSAPAVLFMLSRASASSVFCAWELGYAMARGLPLRVVGLDGTAPTAPIQHLQVMDVPRLRRARPWLDESEAVLLAMLRALG